MPIGRVYLVYLALCLSVASLSSCLARRRVITRTGGTTTQTLLKADEAQLLQRIKEHYDSIRDFSATVDMVPALGTAEKSKITEYKDVRGYILFRKPEHIRIIGLYPVVRNKAFDMVSDGSNFRLYIPAKNRFVTGRNELTVLSKNQLENLRPQHFLEALLVKPWDSQKEKVVLQNLTDEDNAAYILHFLTPKPDGDLSLRRQVWFSRLNLRIARELIFDPDGNILTDARYSDWQEYDRVPFPKRIDITRPRDEYALVLTLVKMDINKSVEVAKFQLEQPAGSVLQVLGEGQKEEAAAENSNGGNRKQ